MLGQCKINDFINKRSSDREEREEGWTTVQVSYSNRIHKITYSLGERGSKQEVFNVSCYEIL